MYDTEYQQIYCKFSARFASNFVHAPLTKAPFSGFLKYRPPKRPNRPSGAKARFPQKNKNRLRPDAQPRLLGNNWMNPLKLGSRYLIQGLTWQKFLAVSMFMAPYPPWLRRVTSNPHCDSFQKYRNAPPISIAMPSSWLEVVCTLPTCIVYTSQLYHDTRAEVLGPGVVGTLPITFGGGKKNQ